MGKMAWGGSASPSSSISLSEGSEHLTGAVGALETSFDGKVNQYQME